MTMEVDDQSTTPLARVRGPPRIRYQNNTNYSRTGRQQAHYLLGEHAVARVLT